MHASAPWLSLPLSLAALRVGTAGFFLAHAVVRMAHDTLPQFALFMASAGFAQPLAVVWAITLVELICGALLIAARHVRLACLGLAAIALGGIVLIHARLGWFVGEYGTGGSEYSVALLLCLWVTAAAATPQRPCMAGGPKNVGP